MLAELAQLLGIGSPLVRAARQDDGEEFLAAFQRTRFYCLRVPRSFAGVIETEGVAPEQVDAFFGRPAADLASEQEYVLFECEVGGRRTVPLFTQERRARVFAEKFARSRRRNIPFHLLKTTGEALLDMLDEPDAIVLDPGTLLTCALAELHVKRLRDAAARRTRVGQASR